MKAKIFILLLFLMGITCQRIHAVTFEKLILDKLTDISSHTIIVNTKDVVITSGSITVKLTPGSTVYVIQSGTWYVNQQGLWNIERSTSHISNFPADYPNSNLLTLIQNGTTIYAYQKGEWRIIESTAYITNFPTDYPDSAVLNQLQNGTSVYQGSFWYVSQEGYWTMVSSDTQTHTLLQTLVNHTSTMMLWDNGSNKAKVSLEGATIQLPVDLQAIFRDFKTEYTSTIGSLETKPASPTSYDCETVGRANISCTATSNGTLYLVEARNSSFSLGVSTMSIGVIGGNTQEVEISLTKRYVKTYFTDISGVGGNLDIDITFSPR